MSSEEITLNSLNSQLVFQDDTLRYNCQQHRVGDSGPKTRELTGFIDDKIFSSVERDRYFRSQPVIYAEPSDRRDPQETRDWNGNADSPSTDESDDDDDDDDDDDELDEAANNNRINSHSNNSNISNCNNNNISMNCSVAAAAEKMGNGKAKNYSSSFGKNGNLLQTINNGAITTIAEADSDAYYSQYLQGTEGSSGSGQKDTVGVDSGGGISGSGESLRAILSDPVTGALMDDAMILPCGHSFGASGVQQLIRTKACFSCLRPVSEDSIAPNLSLRAAVQAFRREEELQFYRACKRRRERFEQDKGSFGDSMDTPRGRGVQFPFSVTDRVVIKGNKRTPPRFVGREAIVTTQCLNGWYVVKTLDNAESVKLQYRSLAKVPDDPSSKGPPPPPMSSKMAPNWL